MKKLLIILIVLLLLGGGGFAAWWFYLRVDPNAPPPPPPPPEFSTLPIPDSEGVLVVNVIKNGKVERHYFMKLTLMFDSLDKREKASELVPALISDFNQELHGLLARKLVEEIKNNSERIELLQQQLQKVCDRRLGPGIVYKVSIDNMEQQP